MADTPVTPLRLLRTNRAFRYVAIGGALSSIGSALTLVIVYGALHRLGASSFGLAMVFVLSLAPGLVGYQIATWLDARFSWATILASTQVLGLLSLVIPALGLVLRSRVLLEISPVLPGFALCVEFPVMQRFIKTQCSDAELAAASLLEAYCFSANVIVGLGIGGLLYQFVDEWLYIAIDGVSYVVGFASVIVAATYGRTLPRPNDESASSGGAGWTALDGRQRLAFMLLPILTILGAPAMALLPAIGSRFGAAVRIGSHTLDPVVMFVMARGIGQMLGPLLVQSHHLERLSRGGRWLVLCGSIFIGCYTWSCITAIWSIAVISVIMAHVSSNVIFVVGSYSLKSRFGEGVITRIASTQGQVCLVLTVTFGTLAGGLSTYISVPYIIISGGMISLAALGVWLGLADRTAVQTQII